MPPRVPVTFSPAGVTIWVEPGSTVAEAAKAASVLLSAPCAGRGVCGGCGVRVVAGALESPDEVETRALARAPLGVRLACRARVAGAVEVRPLYAGAAANDAGPAAALGAAAPPSRDVALVAGIDLGTTSVAALIAEADSGRELARGSVANQQSSFGADVLSRISASLSGESDALRILAENSALAALRAAGEAGGAQVSRIERLVVAGNSAMAALLMGADVTSLASHPFTPPVGGEPLATDSALREAIAPGAEASLVAPMAAFVGGDALAATVAAGLVDVDAPMLLVDLGTNAELVLAKPDGLLVSSTAAGPAFEGVGVSCGGPAIAGAVDRVEILDGAVRLHVIGDAEPRWFSGAGLVSAIVALLAVGHVAPDGAMLADGPLCPQFARDEAGVLGVRLSADGAPLIMLTQLDVRALQLAKAAVRAGIETLLRHAGISAGELGELLVAGAFGAALEPTDLVAIGVLPSNTASKIRRVGNAALEGAAAMALDSGLSDIAAQTAARAVHVDLAADAEFSADFIVATELRPYDA
ncbi:MAG: ASKHA domain-containing protein [Coriobacteriia bacterium]|nr:ASKHA domain-containing protein [Coriobacteriia bacterium]